MDVRACVPGLRARQVEGMDGADIEAELRMHDALAESLLFRPGLWLLLALATCAASWRRRDTRAGAFAIGVTSCAAVYVMSFFTLGVAGDFRYAYWCVLGTLAALVAVGTRRMG